MKLPPFIAEHLERIDRELDRLVPPKDQAPPVLHRAMRYTLLAPSKRVRAVLTLLSAEVCGGGAEAALPAS